MSYLQQQIQARLESKDLTIHALEKKAGLKRSAARNILRGFSKKPSAEALTAIAKALDCSIDDLVGPESYSLASVAKATSPLKGNHQWNEKLYLDATKLVSKCLVDKKIDLKFEQVMLLVDEVYKYSIVQSSDKADQIFVNWLIKKNFGGAD